MSRFRPYKGPKRKTTPRPNALPCVILLAMGFLLLAIMFYLMLQSSST
jgi:hypothetical protein